MIFLQSPPHIALQDHIAQYLWVSVDDPIEFGQLTQTFFPIDIPCMTFYSKPLGVRHRDNGAQEEAACIYSGLNKYGASLSFREQESVHGFIVAFKPHGFAELFRIDNSDFRGMTNFYAVKGREAEWLHEQLEEAGSFAKQVGIADAYFLKKLPAFTVVAPIEAACRQILHTKGEVNIKTLARTSNLSLSSLERKFSKLVGVSPKQFARFKRLHHALKLMGTTTLSLTDIAHTCNFFDQAHFIREFESFTGQPPSLFRMADHSLFYHFVLNRNYYQ